jgi:hypothetical protein
MSDEPAVQEGVTAASEDPPAAVAYPRYTADDNQLFAINRCRDLVIAAGEDYLNGWVLVSINQWDQEQERVLQKPPLLGFFFFFFFFFFFCAFSLL